MKYTYKTATLVCVFVLFKIMMFISQTRLHSEQQYALHNKHGSRDAFKEDISKSKDKDIEMASKNKEFIHRPEVCQGRKLTLVICVISARENFDTRNTIRQTWGSLAQDQTALVFVIGSSSPDAMSDIQRKVDEEFKQHGDIIQGTFVDTYKNLTLKSIFAISWASYFCSNAHFYQKADDDAYVNIPLLISALQDVSKNNTKFILGHKRHRAKRIRVRWSKWYVDRSVYPNSTYPDYTSGGATYAMSMSAVKSIANVIPNVPHINLEDVYITGLCAQKANVTILNDDRIQSSKVTSKSKSAMEPAFRISGGDHNVVEIKDVHALIVAKRKSLKVV